MPAYFRLGLTLCLGGWSALTPQPACAYRAAPAAAETAAPRSTLALVLAERAWLFDLPQPGLSTHTWLECGDVVTLIDQTGDAKWVKIRHRTGVGKFVEQWVHRETLQFMPSAR